MIYFVDIKKLGRSHRDATGKKGHDRIFLFGGGGDQAAFCDRLSIKFPGLPNASIKIFLASGAKIKILVGET